MNRIPSESENIVITASFAAVRPEQTAIRETYVWRIRWLLEQFLLLFFCRIDFVMKFYPLAFRQSWAFSCSYQAVASQLLRLILPLTAAYLQVICVDVFMCEYTDKWQRRFRTANQPGLNHLSFTWFSNSSSILVYFLFSSSTTSPWWSDESQEIFVATTVFANCCLTTIKLRSFDNHISVAIFVEKFSNVNYLIILNCVH